MLQPSCDGFLELLSESLVHPSFTLEDVEFQKNSMRFEREDLEKDPDRRIEELLFRKAFTNHPLGWPSVPTTGAIEKINVEKLGLFHKSTIVGQNLVVAG